MNLLFLLNIENRFCGWYLSECGAEYYKCILMIGNIVYYQTTKSPIVILKSIDLMCNIKW